MIHYCTMDGYSVIHYCTMDGYSVIHYCTMDGYGVWYITAPLMAMVYDVLEAHSNSSSITVSGIKSLRQAYPLINVVSKHPYYFPHLPCQRPFPCQLPVLDIPVCVLSSLKHLPLEHSHSTQRKFTLCWPGWLGLSEWADKTRLIDMNNTWIETINQPVKNVIIC